MVVLSELWIVLLLLCVTEIQGKAFIRLCYFAGWANTRKSEYARFDVKDIDPSLCTHIVYAFAVIDTDSHRLTPASPDEDPGVGWTGRYKKFNDLKINYPHLRTLLSVGGANAGNEPFIAVSKSSRTLEHFASTTVEFLRKRGFDGLDVDWELPDATTKSYFSNLLKALRTAFDADKTGPERLLLTAALPAGKQNIDPGFDIGALNSYLDLANLMTYDYFGSFSDVTGFDSPLFSRKSDSAFDQKLSTEWTVNYYISKGLQKDKILVGVTTAGTHFKLQNTNLTGVGAPIVKSTKPRISDLWELHDRFVYPEICRVLQSASATRVFDKEQGVPYVYQDDDWFGYEDVQSLQGKVEWMLKKGVAGAMFWALDMDDFTGRVCDKGKYPLLKALSHAVGQIEGTHLTEHINPNIRYMTKYTGTASGLKIVWSTMSAAVLGGVIFLWR